MLRHAWGFRFIDAYDTLIKIPHGYPGGEGYTMIEVAAAHLADYDEVLFELEALDCGQETHTVAVTVELPSEFQALLSGLSQDGGKDSSGKHIKLWQNDGIQSINFSDSEPGKAMVFNAKSGYDALNIHTQLTEWLVNLRLGRERTERMLASSAIRSK